MRRAGFTLIELVVVVTLSSIMAAVAMVALLRPHAAAQQRREVDTFIEFERTCRTLATVSRTIHELQFDHQANEIRCIDQGGRLRQALVIGHGVEVHAVIAIPPTGNSDDDRSVFINIRGISRSYAVHFTGPGDRHWWLLAAGGSGLIQEMRSREDVEYVASLFAEVSDYAD